MVLRYHDRTEAPVESTRFTAPLQREIARAESRQTALIVEDFRRSGHCRKKRTGPQERPGKVRLGILNHCEALTVRAAGPGRAIGRAKCPPIRAGRPGQVPALGGCNRNPEFLDVALLRQRRDTDGQMRPEEPAHDRDTRHARGQLLERFVGNMTILCQGRSRHPASPVDKVSSNRRLKNIRNVTNKSDHPNAKGPI